ncbi:hypothetical protein PM082_009369 [Marasmius tenuissimus]|nr:hypothetical protein PM082_009369 [Marasmius tenuissimus]
MNIINTVKDGLAQNLGGVAHRAGSTQFSLDNDVPDLSGKVAIVTGGSEGIGYGATHTFLKHNISKLYILSLSEETVQGAQNAIAQDLGQEAADKTVWKQCDMGDWKRVKEVADEILRDNDRLDILVNNAGRGIMTYELTDYGVDRHMAVNHFGHAIFTSHLLPLLRKTAKNGDTVRISLQASNLHHSAPSDTRFESLEELNRDLGPNPLYGRSKLAAILYARWFARNVTEAGHPNLVMNATHPGIVNTHMSKAEIHEPYPLGGYAMSHGLEPFKKDQFEGATSTVYAATVADRSGQYINPPATPEPGSKPSQDEKLGDSLMELTRRVIKEKTGEEIILA